MVLALVLALIRTLIWQFVSVAHSLIVIYLVPLSIELQSVIIMHNLCPISNVMIRYAIVFGYNRKLTALMVNVSMFLSFFALWAAATFTT